MNKVNLKLLLFLSITLLWQCGGPEKEFYQKQSFSRKGMVVTAHHLATKVGLDILRQGGNAVDAAIATHFALAVVYPRAGNLGGGGFMVYRGQEGQVRTLDFRETAPLRASRNMYFPVEADSSFSSLEGGLAVGVPGSVAGMWAMWQELSPLLAFDVLLAPAIELAEKGFRISVGEADRLNEFKEVFRRYHPAESPFLKKEAWEAGDLLVQTVLAKTLKLIAKEGGEAFYSGRTAADLVMEVNRFGGILSISDLENYQVKWREPVGISYKQYQVYTMGPPSSGGVTISQTLKMIEPFSLEKESLHNSYNVHLCVEASKRAFVDRALYLGDPDFVDISTEDLLSGPYLFEKMKSYQPNKATKVGGDVHANISVDQESFETTHFSIVDSYGNAVAITTTLNSNFGSKVWVSGGGYFLNNEMDDFSIKPGQPNQFGLIGGEANAVAPNKRMLSSMSPTIITKDGQLYLILGSPGGPTIISSVFQVFLNVSEFGMMLADAIALGRFHHQWAPDEIWLERGSFDSDLIESLKQKGHRIKEVNRMGAVAAILRHKTGSYEGAADVRDESHAQGL